VVDAYDALYRRLLGQQPVAEPDESRFTASGGR
jgi:hypothetical protein